MLPSGHMHRYFRAVHTRRRRLQGYHQVTYSMVQESLMLFVHASVKCFCVRNIYRRTMSASIRIDPGRSMLLGRRSHSVA